jgi:uncharacterized protein YdeI (YjbR/CyaY-like superfamily)
MNRTNPKVDASLSRAEKWRNEVEQLRKIILDCQLTEELKWGWPCYTLQESNIVLIHCFKEYCALLFFKGALLKDARGLLIQQMEHVQSARQIRFTNVREIVEREPILKAYIEEAIAVEKAGLKVKLKKTADFKIPEELQNKLKENAALEKGFCRADAGTATRLHFLFFRGQTIQNPGSKGCKMHAKDSQGKRIGR